MQVRPKSTPIRVPDGMKVRRWPGRPAKCGGILTVGQQSLTSHCNGHSLAPSSSPCLAAMISKRLLAVLAFQHEALNLHVWFRNVSIKKYFFCNNEYIYIYCKYNYIRVIIHVGVCIYIYIQLTLCLCHKYVSIHIYTCVNVSIYVLYIYIYIYTFLYQFKYVYIYIYIEKKQEIPK